MYKLLTERLYLVLSEPSLADYVVDFNRRNMQHFSTTEPTRPKEFYTFSGVRRLLCDEKKAANKCEEFRFWVMKKGEKRVIGTVCISSIMFGSVKSCYLSYKIDSEELCQGYCTEAVGEVVHFAFKVLQLHRIECYIMPSNGQSLAIMRKLKFEQEGLSRKCLEVNGVWQDHLRFSMLNEEQ